ncbi:MAG: hypothetical protein NXI31_26605 [bacterium]|nr:hypothetical protein [bacterium]
MDSATPLPNATDSSRQPPPWLRPTVLATLGTLFLLAWFGPYYTLPLLRLIDDWSTLPVADDAFYFLQIARHMADGRGATFDGVHPTSGFQPLWQFVLAGVQWTLRLSPESLVRAAFLLANGLLVLTAWQVAGLLRDAGIDRVRASLIALALLIWAPCATSYFTLCEASLNGFAFVLTLRTAGRVIAGQGTARAQYGLGLLLGVLFLARLDNFMLAATIALAIAIRQRRGGLPILLRIAATLAPIGCGYAVANLLAFGHVMPISGAIKSQWSGPLQWTDVSWWSERLGDRLLWFFAPRALAENSQHIARALAIVALLVAALPFRMAYCQRRRTWPQRTELVLWCALAAFVPKHVYYALCQGHHNQALWYFAPEMLTLVCALGAMARHPAGLAALATTMLVTAWPNGIGAAFSNWWLPLWVWLPAFLVVAILLVTLAAPVARESRPRWPTLLPAAVLPAALLLLALPERQQLWLTPFYHTEKSRLAELGRWVKDVGLTRHGTVGAYSAGLVNYFAGGDVRNLDGLVADWEWYEMQRESGRFPPPRRETFVLDYHPVTKRRLMAVGYVPFLDVLPDYHGSARRKSAVFGVTNDPTAAARVYRQVLENDATPAVLQRHARGVMRRLRLAPSTPATPR